MIKHAQWQCPETGTPKWNAVYYRVLTKNNMSTTKERLYNNNKVQLFYDQKTSNMHLKLRI